MLKQCKECLKNIEEGNFCVECQTNLKKKVSEIFVKHNLKTNEE